VTSLCCAIDRSSVKATARSSHPAATLAHVCARRRRIPDNDSAGRSRTMAAYRVGLGRSPICSASTKKKPGLQRRQLAADRAAESSARRAQHIVTVAPPSLPFVKQQAVPFDHAFAKIVMAALVVFSRSRPKELRLHSAGRRGEGRLRDFSAVERAGSRAIVTPVLGPAAERGRARSQACRSPATRERRDRGRADPWPD
jgi:hypothetical protein